MQLLNPRLVLTTILGLTLFSACKKDDAKAPSSPAPLSEAVLKDSAVIYSKEAYFWYTQIPASFRGSGYSDPNAIMTALRQYSQEPAFGRPVDRWSFAMKSEEWEDVSSGIAGDFGMGLIFRDQSDLRVKYVERDSPAGKAGIGRGWRITKINGSTNITVANADWIEDKVFRSNSTGFTFQKPDNSTVDITLNVATYQEHPIYLDSIYNINSKKIGYLVFNSFLGNKTEIYNEFQTVFNQFVQAGINDLVVDLRYNGGGYVDMQEKLANYLAPSAANGNVMMKQEFNDNLAVYNKTTNFSKLGTLNLNRIFFIVSPSTASASELLINNLKPYMEVILVGPRSTYGKPVGYFPIDVGDWAIFPVSFRTVNKNGQGDYYNGIEVNNQVADGLDKGWGDTEELCLSSALKYITTGAFRLATEGGINERRQLSPAVIAGNEELDKRSFKGMVDARGL